MEIGVQNRRHRRWSARGGLNRLLDRVAEEVRATDPVEGRAELIRELDSRREERECLRLARRVALEVIDGRQRSCNAATARTCLRQRDRDYERRSQ